MRVRNGFDETSRRERRLLFSKAVSSFPNRKRCLQFGFLKNLPGRCRGRCPHRPAQKALFLRKSTANSQLLGRADAGIGPYKVQRLEYAL